MLDALNDHKESITLRLLVLAKITLDQIEKDFLDNFQKAMKDGKNGIMNSKLFDSRGQRKIHWNIGEWRMWRERMHFITLSKRDYIFQKRN